MKKIVVRGCKNDWYFNINMSSIQREEGIIYVYENDVLVGAFDLGSIDAFWISEKS